MSSTISERPGSSGRGTVALLRVAGIALLVLGALIWRGNATLVSAHIAIGVVFVLTLAGLAVLAARAGAPPIVSVLAAVWVVLIPAIGIAQRYSMLGERHWVIQLVHVLFSISAFVVAERLRRYLVPVAAAALLLVSPVRAARSRTAGVARASIVDGAGLVTAESPPTLRVRLFGVLAVQLGGGPLPSVGSARAQSLLAYLILHRDAPQPPSGIYTRNRLERHFRGA